MGTWALGESPGLHGSGVSLQMWGVQDRRPLGSDMGSDRRCWVGQSPNQPESLEPFTPHQLGLGWELHPALAQA